MEENTNAKIDELNKKNIDLGGQSVHNESKEDIEDVKQGNKTVDMVERLMSSEEILEAAKKNSLYSNMVGPCLAGNISLDGRLLEFLNSPMKEIDLEDHITAAMNVLVYEISREQNGLVFNSNGTLNVYQSIQQSVQAGIQLTPALKDTMEERSIERLQRRFEKEKEVGLDAVIKTADFKNTEITIEDIFNRTPKERAKLAADDYRKYVDSVSGAEGKEKLDRERKEAENKRNKDIENVRLKQEELAKAQAEGASKDVIDKLTTELRELEIIVFRDEDNLKSINAASNISKEAINAKAKQAKVTAQSIFGPESDSVRRRKALSREQNNRETAENTDEIIFMNSEKITNILLGNVVRNMLDVQNNQCNRYRNKLENNNQLSEKETKLYILNAVHMYYMCDSIMNSDITNLVDREQLENLKKIAVSSIRTLIPGAVTIGTKANNVDFADNVIQEGVIFDYLIKNGIYKKEGNETTLRELMGDEISAVISDRLECFVIEANEKSSLDEYGEKTELNQELIEAADKDYIINQYNVLKKLNSMGTESVMFKMAKKRLERAGLAEYIEAADSVADAKEGFYMSKIDSYMQDRIAKNFEDFDNYYPKNKMHLLSNEDNMKILSWAIIGNEVLATENDELNMGLREESQLIIKQYLGEDVFDENGEIDQEKFAQRYVKYSTNEQTGDGKYRVLPKDENYNGIVNFHLQMANHEVERVALTKMFDRVELVKKRNQEITNEEAKKAVDEKGEELDDSATKQPIQEENKEKKTTDKQITQEEGDKAMADKGENMHVANPSEVTKESVTVDEKSVDKSAEEKGNAPVAENMVVADDKTKYPVEQKENKNSFIESIKKLGKDIKNMFKSLITGKEYKDSDSSSNNSSTSSDGGKRLNETKENAKVAQQQSFVQTATISVKDAQDKVKQSKEKRAEGQSQENEVEQDENEI